MLKARFQPPPAHLHPRDGGGSPPGALSTGPFVRGGPGPHRTERYRGPARPGVFAAATSTWQATYARRLGEPSPRCWADHEWGGESAPAADTGDGSAWQPAGAASPPSPRSCWSVLRYHERLHPWRRPSGRISHSWTGPRPVGPHAPRDLRAPVFRNAGITSPARG